MKRRTHKKAEKRRWIRAYTVERCYGGGEDGGWWYDWSTPLGRSIRVDRIATKRARAEARLLKLFSHIQQVGYRRDGSTYKIDRFSSIGDGTDLELMLETTPGQWTTKSRPTYE